MRYNNDPRIITAKFESTCSETGRTIKRGQECIYYPSSKKVFCMDSDQAKTFRQWKFDQELLGQNY